METNSPAAAFLQATPHPSLLGAAGLGALRHGVTREAEGPAWSGVISLLPRPSAQAERTEDDGGAESPAR